MNPILVILILFCVFIGCLSGETRDSFNYDSAWKEIDQLMKEGLPKSMGEKVEVLYQEAVKDNETDQQIKALIYQLTMLQEVEEFSAQLAITRVREYLKTATYPASAILHSMLAEQYWDYYTRKRWIISNRSVTLDFRWNDIATWDLKTITKETIKELQLSLQQPGELQKINIVDYPALVTQGGEEERTLRPTLYDFLAHRALEFYKNDESGLTLPVEEFTITDARFFAPADSFAAMPITSPDSLSLKYQAAILFQGLLRFHLQDKDPSALLEVDLERLTFIHNTCLIPDKEQLYEAALRLIQTKYLEYPASAHATYLLASLNNDRAGRYDPDVSEDHRWDYKNALDICQSAISAYPQSFGGRSCEALAKSIMHQGLEVAIEHYVLPNSPIKAIIRVQNQFSVKLSIYKIPQLDIKSDEYDEYHNRYAQSREDSTKVQALLKKKPLWSKTFEFTNEGDYRVHSYELALTSLPLGNYILIATNTEKGIDREKAVLGYSMFFSTELSNVLERNQLGSLLVVNRRTGLPIKGARVRAYQYNFDRDEEDDYYLYWSGKTDKDGRVRIDSEDLDYHTRIQITKGKDILQNFDYVDYTDYYYYEDLQEQGNLIPKHCLMFTDRSIYRPGQTIYLKGVLYESDSEKHYALLPDADLEVEFQDVMGQTIATQIVRTNEYATFNTSFVIPQGILTGEMTIDVVYGRETDAAEDSDFDNSVQGSVSFSVEEYKRPRFEVKLTPPAESFKLNQYVTVKGTALSYAGFPIDNASVTYRITRRPKYPVWIMFSFPLPATSEKEIARGVVQTDSKGEFSLTFLAVADETALPAYDPYFTYSIRADVTDLSGETRTGTLDLNIGEKELLLEPKLAEEIDLQDKQLLIPIKTTNLSGEPVAAEGTLTISRLQTPDHVQKERLWITPDRNYLERTEFLRLFPNDVYGNEDNKTTWKVAETVWSGSFATPEVDSIQILDFSKWKQGKYVLEATAFYKQQEIQAKRYFTVYDSQAKQLPYPMADWLVPVKVVCEPGETAQILIGSGYTDVSVLYEVEKDHVIVSKSRFTLDKEQRLLELPVTEKDRGGFYVHFTFIRDGRLYTHSKRITVPWTNKQLSFEYMTFRDNLLPGQEEEWRLKIKDHTGGKITAEVLASMYDASLDAFRASKWSARIYGSMDTSRGWNNDSFAQAISLSQFYRYWYPDFPTRRFDAFNWYGYNLYEFWKTGMILHIRGGRSNEIDYSVDGMSVSDPVDGGSALLVDKDAIYDMKIMTGGFPAEYGNAQSGVINIVTKDEEIDAAGYKATPQDLSGVQARNNFSETAFFFPELRTDEQGEVSFVFTVPEALTRWKFRAFALSKDFQVGTSENSTVTQKPLMVLPNAPRIFREGDTITFSAKITSLDETDQSGTCQLFLFDALTMKPMEKEFGLKQAQQSFSIKKGESASLSWDLDIPSGISAVTYRVVAQAGDFSDGEENTLPILSNRMLVTESLPLPVRGHTTKSFVFEKLRDSGESSTLKSHKLTLEYTSNPAWVAIQALPYLMEYPYDCNEQIFSRFYANSLASHIANANPRIRKVFDSWRDTPNSAALLSKLEQNPELKAVLLQETPCVLDAQNESQSKQRIGLLFDLNHMASQFTSALSQLYKNQNASGAWPWFPGMQDSWWVTQYLVEGFGHLDKLSVSSIRNELRVWRMVQSAVKYIDREILRDYEEVKKHGLLDDDHLGYMQMHYLYARSYFPDIPIREDVTEAVNYFLDQADTFWQEKDIYGQGLIALALHRNERSATPNKIIASLKEKALHSEELGMWWKNQTQGWFWYQAPIETQSLLIEAFHEVVRDTASIDEMRTWLLKQKQTTNWKTTKATAEACYALLISGTDWLNTDQLAEITIAGNRLDPQTLDGSQVEAGTGYFKTSWQGSEITPQMANISVTNPNAVTSWGSLYWQYFEDLDKITSAETPLSLKKQLFIERISDTGIVLEPVSDKALLSLGDKVIVRIELRSDRDMEYVHLKDMRSAGFEPINALSGFKWQDGLGYYETTGDAATNFFIEYLRKGTYVFEYPLRVFNKGDFSNGVTSIQCMYAPEFGSHSEGIRVRVK